MVGVYHENGSLFIHGCIVASSRACSCASSESRLDRLKKQAHHEINELLLCLKRDKNCDVKRARVYKTVGALILALGAGATYYLWPKKKKAGSKIMLPAKKVYQAEQEIIDRLKELKKTGLGSPQERLDLKKRLGALQNKKKKNNANAAPAVRPAVVPNPGPIVMTPEQQLVELENTYQQEIKKVDQKINTALEQEKNKLAAQLNQAQLHHATLADQPVDTKIQILNIALKVLKGQLSKKQ